MKILIFGFFTFFLWSSFSTYIYVCKIKGLCYEPVTTQNTVVNPTLDNTGNTLLKPIAQKQVVIPENLVTYFAFDKSEFTVDAETDKYVDESNAFLSQNSKATLSITGHTDAIGTEAYNQALGYRRAQRMQLYFERKGIQADKISIISMGETEPADDNNTKAGRANNRRTVITIKN